MDESKSTPSWLVYERCVAAFSLEQNPDLQVTVQPNVILVGRLSGVKRQIDVLIDSRWKNGENRRIIVDAKERNRRVDIKDIESFEGMMRDCNAKRGVIVCSNGYTDGALKRAQDAITITVLSLEEFDEYNWVYKPCAGKCHGKSQSKRGMVLWAAYMGIPLSEDGPLLIFQTGKCDGCHSFHVWCWECGSKFPISDNTLYRCECGHDWIAYLSREENAVLLTFRADEEFGVVIDRRPVF
jgi:hypothetical protein